MASHAVHAAGTTYTRTSSRCPHYDSRTYQLWTDCIVLPRPTCFSRSELLPCQHCSGRRQLCGLPQQMRQLHVRDQLHHVHGGLCAQFWVMR